MTKGAVLFWTITQRVLVIPFRRFGPTYRSHLRGSRIQEGTSKSHTVMTRLLDAFRNFANALINENPLLLPAAAAAAAAAAVVVIW